MPLRVPKQNYRRPVRFPKLNNVFVKNNPSHSTREAALMQNQNAGQSAAASNLPTWLTDEPLIEDNYPTESSELLLQTAEECLPFLLGLHTDSDASSGLPPLANAKHVRFLQKSMGRLPAPFVGLDASRPWMFYWSLVGLSLLGQDISPYRDRLISSLKPIQNTTGGFGGGQGQYSHLATSYATVLSLATVGGVEAYDLLDRRAMWHWLGRLKQPGGEFEVCEGGECDVRGALCAMVIVSLLNLPIDLSDDSPAKVIGNETLLTGLAEWVGACQTYEGGLGSNPGAEAHGAYTFCGLACLCILGEPADMFNKYLDFPSLLRWLSARQHAPEGGLAGRTNKLVDNCYSHWIGGCWSLVEAAAQTSSLPDRDAPSLFNREGLVRYILCCGQSETGGLRDKPSKPADAYHTQYGLAGLSAAQNFYQYDAAEAHIDVRHLFAAAFKWKASKHAPGKSSADEANAPDPDDASRAALIHPIYIIPWSAAEAIAAHFQASPLPAHTDTHAAKENQPPSASAPAVKTP